jgi:hypothetical protein
VWQVDASRQGVLRTDARPPGRVPYSSSPGRPQGTGDRASARADTRHPGGQVSLEPGVQAQAHGPDPGAVRPDAGDSGVRLRDVPHAVRGRQRICIDHDHACCPPSTPTRCCGKCVRGLLCLTCNIALGYIEAYSELAMTYLRQGTALRPASPQPAGRSGLAVLCGGDGDPRERCLDQQVQRRIQSFLSCSVSRRPTWLQTLPELHQDERVSGGLRVDLEADRPIGLVHRGGRRFRTSTLACPSRATNSRPEPARLSPRTLPDAGTHGAPRPPAPERLLCFGSAELLRSSAIRWSCDLATPATAQRPGGPPATLPWRSSCSMTGSSPLRACCMLSELTHNEAIKAPTS